MSYVKILFTQSGDLLGGGPVVLTWLVVNPKLMGAVTPNGNPMSAFDTKQKSS
jgi:hypothetical protein